jgi:hypothetical protein
MQLFSNNGSSVLSAAITNSGTTLTFVGGGGAEFNAPTGGDYELLTLTDGVNAEIVKMTARSSDSATIARGQESTTALAWPIGTTAEGRVTKGSLNRFPQNNATGTDALALGTASTATATDSLSMGHTAAATAVNSIALGKSATNPALSAQTIGYLAQIKLPVAWQASHAYVVGDLIKKVGDSTKGFYRCVTAGTSGGSEPSWPSFHVNSTLIADNTVSWEILETDELVSKTNEQSVVLGSNAVAAGGYNVVAGSSNFASGHSIAIGHQVDSVTGGIGIGEGVSAVDNGVVIGNLANNKLPPRWTAGQTVAKGTIVRSSTGRLFINQTFPGGVSGSTEPTWGSTYGGGTNETMVGANVITWRLLDDLGGAGSLSIGQSAYAVGDDSVVVGALARASRSSVNIGNYTYSSGEAVAVGDSANVMNWSGIAIGYGTVVDYAAGDAYGGIAIGAYASVTGQYSSIAIGEDSINRLSECHVITGMRLTRKDDGESASSEHVNYTGSQSTVFSKEIDLKTLADDVATITIPTGATFFVDEIGLIVTLASGVSTQPDVSFGITGNTTSILASTASTKAAAKGRDIFTPLSKDGVNSLTASVKTAATGTTLKGRFYWKGILVEDE